MAQNTKISRRLTGLKYELWDCAKGNLNNKIYEQSQPEPKQETQSEEQKQSFDDLLKMLENEK